MNISALLDSHFDLYYRIIILNIYSTADFQETLRMFALLYKTTLYNINYYCIYLINSHCTVYTQKLQK